MKELKNTSKKANNYICRYLNTTATTLRDCYSNYSYAKENAYLHCVSVMNELSGYNMRIISHNCNFFTVAFLIKNGLVVITPYDKYVIKGVSVYE